MCGLTAHGGRVRWKTKGKCDLAKGALIAGFEFLKDALDQGAEAIDHLCIARQQREATSCIELRFNIVISGGILEFASHQVVVLRDRNAIYGFERISLNHPANGGARVLQVIL